MTLVSQGHFIKFHCEATVDGDYKVDFNSCNLTTLREKILYFKFSYLNSTGILCILLIHRSTSQRVEQKLISSSTAERVETIEKNEYKIFNLTRDLN